MGLENSLISMLAALMVVLALMGLLALALRHIGLGGGPIPTTPGGENPGPWWQRLLVNPRARHGSAAPARRLAIIETLSLSPQHRAIILRMDATDHLVILGQGGHSSLHRQGEGQGGHSSIRRQGERHDNHATDHQRPNDNP